MGAENKIGLQLAGIEFLPPDLFLDDAGMVRRLLEAADSGQFDPAQLPLPKLPIRQIFADPQGDHYLVVPTTGDSPLALPYITGSELGDLADMGQGGFMSVDALAKVSPPKASGDFPDPAALMGQLTTDIVKSVAEGGSATGAILGQFQSQLTGLALSHVPEEFRGIAKQAINKGLEYGPKLLDGLMSGDLSGAIKNPLANVSMGDVSDMAVGGLADMGFSALADAWKVDDHSSTLEHAAHQYGMQALGMIKGQITEQMQSFMKDVISGQLGTAVDKLSSGVGSSLNGLKNWFNLFFNGMSSGAILPAAHIASKDDKIDVVITGLPSVLVEGKPISRIKDLLDPSKKIILEGAATVLAGGMPVGRVTSDTAIPSDLLTGAATILIGGPSAKISAPVAPRGGAGGGTGNGKAADGETEGSGNSGDKEKSGISNEDEKSTPKDKKSDKSDTSQSKQTVDGGMEGSGNSGDKEKSGISNEDEKSTPKDKKSDKSDTSQSKQTVDGGVRNSNQADTNKQPNESSKDLGKNDNPVREFPIREGGLLGGDNAIIKQSSDLLSCDRPAFNNNAAGRHAYLEDPDTGERIGGFTGREQQGQGFQCKPIPGTSDPEVKRNILDRLNQINKDQKNSWWPWIPRFNDCHTAVEQAVKEGGEGKVQFPGTPLGRIDEDKLWDRINQMYNPFYKKDQSK